MKKLLAILAVSALVSSTALASPFTDDKDKKCKKECCKKSQKACAGEKKEGCSKEGKSCCKKKAEESKKEESKS